jgi:hypothetical protein
MSAVTQVIPNMLGGVSQQPDPIKLPGQVREAINAYLDPTFGCRKRPATKFIAELDTDIPLSAKWLSIFRDQSERYVVACYHDTGAFVVRVWEAATGVERTVAINAAADTYFDGANTEDISHVTIGDYTLIANGNRVVSMGGGTPVPAEAAFVAIDQLGYNTTYSIYLDKDGSAGPTPQYRATKIEVLPGSYEEADGGVCSANSIQTHTVASGGKTGLSFTLSNLCSAYLKNTGVTSATKAQATKSHVQVGVYNYTYSDSTGSVTVAMERQVYTSGRTASYRRTVKVIGGSGIRKGASFTTDRGEVVVITEEATSTTQAYVSRYTTTVLLKNGGAGWRVGDTVNVTQGGDVFTIRVIEEAFDYVYASDGSVTYTSPVDTSAGTLSIGTATASLASLVNGVSGYAANTVGNTIRIRRTDTRSFNVSVKGGSFNNAMSVVKGVARDVSALPTQCWDGEVIKVRNTEASTADDYYVKFVADVSGIPGTGSWIETVKPGITTGLNSSTMPFALIREADGDFAFGPLNDTSALGGWGVREVGDETTNPDPSFVGNTINNLLFYNNRLGILSGENLILGQPSDYFNFFVKSAIALSDADPIDVAVTSSRPSKLRAAVATQKGLVIFSDDSQYIVKSDEARFSAQTIEVKQLSSYPSSSRALPQSSGVSIFFAVEADTYSKIMEMAVDSVGERPAVADDTRIVPQYIPKDLTWITASPANDLVLIGDKTTQVRVFKFFNQGEERKIAGWATWEFPGGVVLMDGHVDTFYMVQRHGSSTFLTTMELLDDSAEGGVDAGFANFVPRLDNYIDSTDITPVTVGTDEKLYFPAGSFITGFQPVFIATSGEDEGVILRPDIQSDGGGSYITVPADLTTVLYTIGLQYTMSVELPSFYTTIQQRPDLAFPPMVENVYLNLYYSGRYIAEVARDGYETYEVDLSVGRADIYEANEALVVENATMPVPIFCRGDQVKVTVRAEDPTPSSLSSYSWQGHYNTRGISLIQ